MDLHETLCVEANEDASPSNSDSSPKSVFASSPISSVAHSPVKERAVTPTSRKHFAQVKELLELCKPGSHLKHLVKECFDHVVCDPVEPALDLQAFMIFITELASSLGMAEDAFGDGTDEFLRFDFGGTGTVNIQECFKFARYHIKDYAKNLAPSLFDVQLPHKTLDEEGYRIGEKVGRGLFRRDVACSEQTWRRSRHQVLLEVQGRRQGPGRAQRGVQCYEKTEHPNIAETFDIFQDDELYYLVNKPYFGGELVVLTERASKSGVAMVEDWWRRIFKQCFEGLRYLHRHAMMHCDIKEPNIMMKTTDYSAPEMVIIDYGLVQAYTKDRVTICGTPGYIPPETWRTKSGIPRVTFSHWASASCSCWRTSTASLLRIAPRCLKSRRRRSTDPRLSSSCPSRGCVYQALLAVYWQETSRTDSQCIARWKILGSTTSPHLRMYTIRLVTDPPRMKPSSLRHRLLAACRPQS